MAGIPIERTGALLVAWDDDQVASLPGIAENAARNGYASTEPVAPAEIYRIEPHLGPGGLGGLRIPDEALICPFTPPLAFATQAVRMSFTTDRPFFPYREPSDQREGETVFAGRFLRVFLVAGQRMQGALDDPT